MQLRKFAGNGKLLCLTLPLLFALSFLGMAMSTPRAYAASTSDHPGVSLQTMADAEKGKHACKGQNECKGQGGCKTSDAGCKGKNSCKGKGGCATDGSKPPQIL